MIKKDEKQKPDVKDHLANERTFLAWIRTSIGIMAFGFVIDKFALFMEKITIFLGKEHSMMPLHKSSLQGYSFIFGVILEAFGVLISILAFIKYKQVEKQIESNQYKPSIVLDLMLTLSVLIIGVFLAIYLNNSL